MSDAGVRNAFGDVQATPDRPGRGRAATGVRKPRRRGRSRARGGGDRAAGQSSSTTSNRSSCSSGVTVTFLVRVDQPDSTFWYHSGIAGMSCRISFSACW